MAEHRSEVEKRLDELTARLAAVEHLLGVAPKAAAVPPSPPVEIVAATEMPTVMPPVMPPIAPAVMGQATTPPIVRNTRAAEERQRREGAYSAFKRMVGPTAAPNAQRGAGSRVAAPSRTAAASEWSLERLVGGKVVLVIGSIVMVIGVVLLLKLMVDRGYFHMPPAYRCIGVAALGVALLAAGELARRWINALASAGLSSVGVATLYAVALASHSMYNLVSAPTAWVMLAAASAIGVGVALRANLLVMAVLSLVGAYLAPLIAHNQPPSPLVLPAYVLALLGFGLWLSGWRPIPFRAVRIVAWWGLVIVGTYCAAINAEGHPWVSLVFLAAAWAAVHAELYLGARRLPEGVDTRVDEEGDGSQSRPVAPAPGAAISLRSARPMLRSFGTTLWGVAVAVIVVRVTPLPIPEDWVVCALGTVVTLLGALMLAGNLRVLRDVPETDGERLGVSLLMQAAGLLIAAVALGLNGWLEVSAWLGMGTAAVAAGLWGRARALYVYGLILLLISFGRLVVWDSWNTGTAPLSFSLLGLPLTQWTVVSMIASAAWIGSAVMLLRDGGRVWRGLAVGATGAGLLLLYGSFLSVNVGAWLGTLSMVWLVLSLMVMGVSVAEPRLKFDRYALGGFGASMVVWALKYPLQDWEGVAPLLLHPGLLTGLAIVAGISAGAWWVRRRAAPGDGIAGACFALMVGMAMVVLLTATTLEVRRGAEVLITDQTAKKAAISIWWGLFAVGMLVVGFAKRVPIVRHIGLGLLFVATGKAAILDTWGMAAEWRVASFLGLGMLLVAVAIAYARVTKKLGEKQPAVTPGTGDQEEEAGGVS